MNNKKLKPKKTLKCKFMRTDKDGVVEEFSFECDADKFDFSKVYKQWREKVNS